MKKRVILAGLIVLVMVTFGYIEASAVDNSGVTLLGGVNTSDSGYYNMDTGTNSNRDIVTQSMWDLNPVAYTEPTASYIYFRIFSPQKITPEIIKGELKFPAVYDNGQWRLVVKPNADCGFCVEIVVRGIPVVNLPGTSVTVMAQSDTGTDFAQWSATVSNGKPPAWKIFLPLIVRP